MIRIFKHYVPVPLLLLALIETIVFFSSMYAGAYIRFFLNSYWEGLQYIGPIYPRAILFTVIMLIVMTTLGMYKREVKEGDWGYYSRLMASFPIGFTVMTLFFYAVPGVYLGRGVVGLSFIVAFFAVLVCRFIFGKLVGSEIVKHRILVLGAGSRPAQLTLMERPGKSDTNYSLVGYIPAGPIDPSIEKSLVIEKSASLLALAEQLDIDEIVVGIRQRRGGSLPMNELYECRMEGINVIDLSSFIERETGKVLLDSLNPSWLIFSEGFNRGNLHNTLKRIFDVVASSILFLFSFPLILFTAVLIKLESKGPVLYRQQRVGECGYPFDVLKFRSMRTDAEESGKPQWAKEKDNRVTRVGRIIRMLRIDELPQVFNVLRGEMSFVGPRPERPYLSSN